MLHIQKALEKIKSGANKPASDWVHSPLESIKYQSTKVQDIERHHLVENRVVATADRDAVGQLFKTLRTKVLREMRKNNWRCIGITSASEGEGKSTIAANLAIALSMELNQSVLLIDTDLHRPKLADIFGLDSEIGIADFLDGRCEASETLVNPGIDRLVIMPGAGQRANSAELLSSPKMTSFIREAKDRYRSRIIVLDLPALQPTDDVMSAFSYLDCTLLVVEDGKSSQKELQRAVQMLRSTNFMGTVLNKVNSLMSQFRPLS